MLLSKGRILLRDYNSKKTNIKNIAAVIPAGRKKTSGQSAAEGKTGLSKKTKSLPKASGKTSKKTSGSVKSGSKASTKKTAAKKTSSKASAAKKAENLKIIPIGGLNEIGKNMTVLEYKDQIMIIDCGMSFPEDEMYGIDVVIPDFSYVVKNASKIKVTGKKLDQKIYYRHSDYVGGMKEFTLREMMAKKPEKQLSPERKALISAWRFQS